jgi:hypothetical protein
MASVLAKEIRTYEKHRDDLLTDSEGKYVLIKADKVVGTFESKYDAIQEGYRRFGNVPFLVKKIVKIEVPLDFVSGLLKV